MHYIPKLESTLWCEALRTSCFKIIPAFHKQIGKTDIEGAVIAVLFMHGRNFLSVNLIPRKF